MHAVTIWLSLVRTTAGQVRNWHKWLGLVLGAQMLIWCVSGLYMVSFDIDFIRGLPLVRAHEPSVRTESLTPVAALLQAHPGVLSVKLTSLPVPLGITRIGL